MLALHAYSAFPGFLMHIECAPAASWAVQPDCLKASLCRNIFQPWQSSASATQTSACLLARQGQLSYKKIITSPLDSARPHRLVYITHQLRNCFACACSFLGPMLFGCLMALIVWSVFQIFLPPGPVQNTIFSLLGSILFSAYIVYDTDNLIQRKSSYSCHLLAWRALLTAYHNMTSITSFRWV